MTLKQQIEVTLIIPVYNEVDNVELLHHEIVAALPPERFIYEIIFVDDGSTDGTFARLQNLAQKNLTTRVVYHKRNYGQSAALLSGARAARYSMLVTLDGDGQNDPADIPRLFDQLHDFNTVVLGNRQKRADNHLRKISSLIANKIRRFILKDECSDANCSLKLFPRDAFLALPHFNHLHRFLPALFHRAGFKLVNLPVHHRPRIHGMSKYGVMNRLFVGIHDLIGVRWLLKRPCAPEIISHEY